jgi:EpsI family protein
MIKRWRKETAEEAKRPLAPLSRVALCTGLLLGGLGAQAGLERLTVTSRPPLRKSLDAIPLNLGTWVGRDEPVDQAVREKSQATAILNRVYVDTAHPGRSVGLWVNYSEFGLNLRHSPEICLPSGGWQKVESQSRTVEVPAPGKQLLPVSRLAYSKGELVQTIGFWYYIFGEGQLEHFVRSLPITSRSSHGRTTRGSGMTVEVFCPGENDPDGQALQDFAQELLKALEPALPTERANYFVP